MTQRLAEEDACILHSLSFAGQILVWSGRQWVNRRSDWPVVEDELAGPMGPAAARALAEALDDFYAVLDEASLRPLVFGRKSSREIKRDEALIVRLVMLEQRHRSAWVFACLEQILPRAAARRAVALVASIADLLDRAGYEVSLPAAESDPSRPAVPAQVDEAEATIH